MRSVLAVLLVGSLLTAACGAAPAAEEPANTQGEPIVTVYQSPT